MTEAADRELTPSVARRRRLGAAFARPKRLAVICVVALAGLGWLYLALMIAGHDGPLAALGPGMGLLDRLPRALQVLCRPDFGVAAMPHGGWGATGFALVALMWGAMTLAMMLPSAAPMILTYAEIADTAARKGERVVSPFVLAAGYMVVWLGFAVAATVAQLALRAPRCCSMPAWPRPADCSRARSSSRAGVYQFSALKHACLKQCQRAVPVLLRQLGDHAARRVPARRQAGALLPRLLLGDDAGDVRGRRDERDLDGGARHRDDDREDRHRQAASPMPSAWC